MDRSDVRHGRARALVLAQLEHSERHSRDGLPFSMLGLTVTDGLITEIDILADPDRLGQLDLSGL